MASTISKHCLLSAFKYLRDQSQNTEFVHRFLTVQLYLTIIALYGLYIICCATVYEGVLWKPQDKSYEVLYRHNTLYGVSYR